MNLQQAQLVTTSINAMVYLRGHRLDLDNWAANGVEGWAYDEMAAADSQLRVHGIDGLRVADAPVMPRITNGNINAPCMMIGERAADLITATW